MSCTCNRQYQKSILNAYTNQSQILTTGQTLKFNNINQLDGSSIDFSAGTGSIVLNKPGVYKIDVNATGVEAGTAGTITLQIQKNGVNINGATASTTSSTITDIKNLSISTVVKVLPSCASVDNTTIITVLNTGVGTTYSNVNITAIKQC
jgi:hypothetical protein